MYIYVYVCVCVCVYREREFQDFNELLYLLYVRQRNKARSLDLSGDFDILNSVNS